jgi:hypothetical protein
MASPIIKHFRELRYGDEYSFRYVRKFTGTWEVYCLRRPANTSYSNSGAQTHLLPGDRLCITADRAPRTFEQAVARSWQWLAGYSRYIREGNFPNEQVRVITPDYDDDGNRTDT